MNGDKNLSASIHLRFSMFPYRQCLRSILFSCLLFVYLRQVSALFNSSLIAQRQNILFGTIPLQGNIFHDVRHHHGSHKIAIVFARCLLLFFSFWQPS